MHVVVGSVGSMQVVVGSGNVEGRIGSRAFEWGRV